MEAEKIAQQKQQELEDLDQKQEQIKAAQLKMMKDLQDHIAVVKMGQADVEIEIKDADAAYKLERKKFEQFLVRDREKLGYAKEQVQTRRMVYMSYEKEMERVQAKLEVALKKEKE